MKIKVALLDADKTYLDRIASVFNTKYADKLEIHAFTEERAAIEAVNTTRIDVFIADEQFEIDRTQFTRSCGVAYFTETSGVESIKDEVAICKFQKAELIFKQILSLYSDMASNMASMTGDGENTQLIVFTSPCGGAGTSVSAAACAIAHARRGRRVFYLNLDPYGTTDDFFRGEGQFSLSDVIYSLKSRKTNMMLKLESCIRQSEDGVSFFASSKVALDLLEMNSEDIESLLINIRNTGNFDELILDLPFSLERDTRKLLEKAAKIIMVNDGSELSNTKLMRAYESLMILEQNEEADLLRRMSLIYNKFSNKSSAMVEGIGIKTIGGAPKYEHATVSQILNELIRMEHNNIIMQ